MKKGDWNDLEFMNNNWELRELKPKRKLRRKYSFTEAETEEEYQELKKQLAVDTTVISTIRSLRRWGLQHVGFDLVATRIGWKFLLEPTV